MASRRDLIFVVDNDRAVRDALQFALRLESLCVHVHSGGAALLADPDLNRAGCVILADQMRHMDGFALLNNMQDRNISLPSIILSSHATPKVRARAHEAGVRTVLEKPLLDNALVETVWSILTAGDQSPIARSGPFNAR